jgi:hypothetical protein
MVKEVKYPKLYNLIKNNRGINQLIADELYKKIVRNFLLVDKNSDMYKYADKRFKQIFEERENNNNIIAEPFIVKSNNKKNNNNNADHYRTSDKAFKNIMKAAAAAAIKPDKKPIYMRTRTHKRKQRNENIKT